jgi:spore coat polysaccharide biosynthesis protein SpsF
LPGKALLPLGGQPMVLFLLNRLRGVRGGRVVLATTTLPSDDRLAEVVSATGVPVFRGAPEDLVQRHYDLAKEFGFDTLVRVTADCPFVDAELIEYCLGAMASIEDCDLVTTKGSFPVGLDAELFSFAVLQGLNVGGQLSAQDREHLTLHLYHNADRVARLQLPAAWPSSNLAFTVDTPADYERAQQLVERMGCGDFSAQALLELE